MIKIDFDIQYFREQFSELTKLRFSRSINAATRRIAKYTVDELRLPTLAWDENVTFKTKLKLNPSHDEQYFEVYTDNKIYNWVNFGTEPHEIKPKKRRKKVSKNNVTGITLAYPDPDDFIPKSDPNTLQANIGHYSDVMVFSRTVHHPGIEPRKFSEKALEIVSRDLERIVFEEMQKSLDRQLSRKSPRR